jgi:sugar/nucleoside kinase (ribokinase family)
MPSNCIYVSSPANSTEHLQVIEYVGHPTLYTCGEVLTNYIYSTVGAGDTFAAGMLYGLICHGDDWSLLEKLQFANKIAGIKVVQEGFSGLGAALKTCSSSLKSHSIC